MCNFLGDNFFFASRSPSRLERLPPSFLSLSLSLFLYLSLSFCLSLSLGQTSITFLFINLRCSSSRDGVEEFCEIIFQEKKCLLESISPTFYEQLFSKFSFTQKNTNTNCKCREAVILFKKCWHICAMHSIEQRFSTLEAWGPTKGYWKTFGSPPNTFSTFLVSFRPLIVLKLTYLVVSWCLCSL